MFQRLHERFGKKVWLTEYGCHIFGDDGRPCKVEEADNLMKTTSEWFRANPDVIERWAWFGAFGDMTKYVPACLSSYPFRSPLLPPWRAYADKGNSWQDQFDMDANRIANADGTVSDKGKKYLSM